MALDRRQFSTGTTYLDRRLDGGIPCGTILAFTSPPDAQSEVFFRDIASTRKTLYVSTTNSRESEVARFLGDDRDGDSLAVQFWRPSEIIDRSHELFASIEPESYVIIDHVAEVERADRDEYRAFLNALADRVQEVDSVAVLHCLSSGSGFPAPDARPANRDLTLKRAHHAWELQNYVAESEIKNRLLIKKSRGYRALSKAVPLIITDDVRVDNSRNI